MSITKIQGFRTLPILLILLSVTLFFSVVTQAHATDCDAAMNGTVCTNGSGVSGTCGDMGNGTRGCIVGNGQNNQGQGQNPGSGTLVNPLKFGTIPEFLQAIIDVILVFALPIIVFFIMYAGFLYVTARGEAAQITKARSALTWAVIGGVIVLGAKLIITLIQGTIAAF